MGGLPCSLVDILGFYCSCSYELNASYVEVVSVGVVEAQFLIIFNVLFCMINKDVECMAAMLEDAGGDRFLCCVRMLY